MVALAAVPSAHPLGEAVLHSTAASHDLRRDFPYRDRELLAPGQRLGGRLWVPASARHQSAALPVLVVLHGLNAAGDMHRLVSDDDYDVTHVVGRLIARNLIRPMIVAAPTQTVHAGNGRTLWTDFDLEHFLSAVERYLPPG